MKTPQRGFVWMTLFVLLSATLFFHGCTAAPDPWEEAPGDGPRVLASFPPLYCFAKGVAGKHAKVLCLIEREGPHDHSPQAQDALKAVNADLFIVNGFGLDDWVARVKNSSGNTDLEVVEVAEHIDHELIIHEGGDDDHAHDPHIWLGIEQAKSMVEVICDKLSELEPKHKEYYEKNAQDYLKELDKLHAYGKKKLGKIDNKKIVATHDSLAYFAQSFGLDVVDNLMPQPGVEADAAKLKKLTALCTDEKAPVRVITTEPQYSKTTAETLIRQVQEKIQHRKRIPRIAEFDTLETATPGFEVDYYMVKMKENINALAKALK